MQNLNHNHYNFQQSRTKGLEIEPQSDEDPSHTYREAPQFDMYVTFVIFTSIVYLIPIYRAPYATDRYDSSAGPWQGSVCANGDSGYTNTYLRLEFQIPALDLPFHGTLIQLSQTSAKSR